MAKIDFEKPMYVDVCGVPFLYREYTPNSRADNSMGRSDSVKAVINICSDMSKEMKESVLIHEWLHSVLDCSGLGELSNNENLVSTLQNELYRAGFRIKAKCTEAISKVYKPTDVKLFDKESE